MERTASQIVRQQTVRRVREHVTEREEPISKLARTASALTKGEEPSREGFRNVVEVEKQARNLGEDLLEDLLSLDQLSNLFPEDKSARKAEIARIDYLLELVDATKAKLASHRRALESKLETSSPEPQTSTSANDADTDDADSEQESDAREPVMSELDTESAPDPAVEVPPTHKAPSETWESVMPAKDAWRRVHLPLQFRIQEAPTGYVLVARAPGLDEKSIELVLGDRGTTLTVEGARVPTASEAAQLQQAIAARYPQVATAPAAALRQRCLELGRGTFGSFSQTFELPADADVDGISASLDGGLLRVVIPRVQRRQLHAPPRARAAPWGYGGYGSPHSRFPQQSHRSRGGYPGYPDMLHRGFF